MKFYSKLLFSLYDTYLILLGSCLYSFSDEGTKHIFQRPKTKENGTILFVRKVVS